MATYVNDLRLKEITTGDESGTWGTSTNTNLELIAEAFSYGTEVITTNADTHTTTIADGATDPGRSLYLKYTGTLDSACTITIGPNTVSKVWIIENGTSGSQDIILSQGSGANITIPAGDTKVVYSDGAGAGAAFFDAFASLSVVDLKVQDDLTVTGDIDVDGTTNLDVVDVDGAVNFAADVTFADGADIITASAGTSNFRAGVNAGNSIESGGNYNAVVGDEAGTAITTGDGNVAVGFNALAQEDEHGLNVAIGNSALYTQNAGADAYNTAVGYSAGFAVTTGVRNTIIGGLAGDALTTGQQNTALGFGALSSDTKGQTSVAIGKSALESQNFTSDTATYNTAVGYSVGAALTTGIQNTLIGGLAGDAITTGDNSVAVGYLALSATTTASDNNAFGVNALSSNTTGANNTGLGRSALRNNTTASNNTAVGHNALYANTEGDYNTAIGQLSLTTNITGRFNVASGVDALRRNTTGSFNTATGYTALEDNTTADNNTAYGAYALGANTTGADNTAVGMSALLTSTTGTNNVALGTKALMDSTTGDYNTAVGAYANENNTTGTSNVSVGRAALNENSTGNDNVAIGRNALLANTTASNNTAVGYQALTANTTASNNVAIGYRASSGSTTANSNTIIGHLAGSSLTTGSDNTFIGLNAGAHGVATSTGYQNILIGNYTDTTAEGTINANAIGYNVSGEGGYTTVGNAASDIRAAHGSITWATVSDVRVKKDIEDSTVGLNFINDLRPVTFNYKNKGDLPKEFRGYEEGSTEVYKSEKTQHGFIAQEVKSAIDKNSDIKNGFSMWDEDDDTGQQRVGETALVPVLVKAIQELSTQVDELKSELLALKGE
jgi:trimeric autotransporter adhesin